MKYHPRNTAICDIDDPILRDMIDQLNTAAELDLGSEQDSSFDGYLLLYFQSRRGRSVTLKHIPLPYPLNQKFECLGDTLIHDFCRQVFPGHGYSTGQFEGAKLFTVLKKVYTKSRIRARR